MVLNDGYFGAPYAACYLVWGLPVPAGVNLIADPSAATQPTIETEPGYDQPVFDFVASLGSCGAVGAPCSADSDCCSSGIAQACALEGSAGNNACAIGGVCVLRPPDNRQYLWNLEGQNLVQGLRIHDNHRATFSSVVTPGGCVEPVQSPAGGAVLVTGNDVTFSGDFFDNTYAGIVMYGGAPTLPDGLAGYMNLVVTGNRFGTFTDGLGAGILEDSVLSNNTFWPGASPDPIAAGARGSRRWDISGNLVDGTNVTYAGPYKGFRGGFIFPIFSSQEEVLVASNTIRCVGSRPYNNGEAIGVDSNGDVPGLRSGELVQAVSPPVHPTQVTIRWPGSENLAPSQSPSDYIGRWLAVDYGQGLGQARKIVAVSSPAATLTFTVSPAFDVAPLAGASRVLISHRAWQLSVVGNTIDNTCSTALDLTNLYPDAAGVIQLYGASSDVAVDTNTLIDTAGISTWAEYADWTFTSPSGATHLAYQSPQYFIDVRGNTLQGQFGGAASAQNGFGSGIQLYSLSGTLIDGVPQPNPNWPGFGISVSHNTLQSAALTGAGICTTLASGIALAPIQEGDQSISPGFVDTLIFKNQIGGTPASLGVPWSTAISNGCYNGEANYPTGTVICSNHYAGFTALDADWPAPGEVSSMYTACGN
jgi:hypothetical protein